MISNIASVNAETNIEIQLYFVKADSIWKYVKQCIFFLLFVKFIFHKNVIYINRITIIFQ